MIKFINRSEAGKLLAKRLAAYVNKPSTFVLALPRGGVPVAFEIAQQLKLPLDVFIVRKLGVPGHEELAMGALAPNQTLYFNEEIIEELGIPKKVINEVIQAEQKELDRRNEVYRQGHLFPDLQGKIIILVDDGIATGASMRVAIDALKKFKPARIIVSIPVADPTVSKTIAHHANEVIALCQPECLTSVGEWYEDFRQTGDEEVIELLSRATH